MKIINKSFLLFLLLLVIISYGQITNFTPWEDDNALFFKLNHLQDSAGFLGPGVFGVGPYRYTATVYLPVFYLFNNFLPAFFIYSMFFYLLTTIVIYLSLQKIIGKTGGQVAAFLFGCGYIASDGFIRLFNSVPTSISIILTCFFLLAYWQYRQYNKIIYLILTLLFFTASLELIPSRTHYFIGIVFISEIIFLSFKDFPKQLIFSLTRLSLFFFIFYKFFLESADNRSRNVIFLIQEILQGHFWNLQGFFVTLTNLIIPSWFINISLDLQTKLILVSNLGIPWLKLAALATGLIFCLILLRTQRISRQLALLSTIGLLVWSFILSHIFINPTIKASEETLLRLFLGGEIIILLTLLSQVVAHQQKRLYFLLLFWILLNIIAYIAYDPNGNIPQISRYLANSFFPLVGLLALIFVNFWHRSLTGTLLALVIITWGINNLISSILYQSDFRQNRILPIETFYHQLSYLTPQLSLGSILYFDVSENSSSYFFNAITSSQMPDTTAIALRYGLDRNDIKLFQDFNDLKNYLIKNPSSLNNIHTYFYNNQKLLDTTKSLKQSFLNKHQSILYTQRFTNQYPTNTPIAFNFPSLIPSSFPLLLTITASAYPMDNNLPKNSTLTNNQLIKQIFSYQRQKIELINKAKFSATSEWHKNITSNLHDGNEDTYWQPNRVLFEKGQQTLTIAFPEEVEISKLAWINSYSDNAPKNIFLSFSVDNQNWQILKNQDLQEENNQKLTILSFPTQKARYLKIAIPNSLSKEAPAIAEMWLLKDSLTGTDIIRLEKSLANPFLLANDKKSFSEILSLLSFQGKVEFYWKNNKSNDWQTDFSTKINLIYDGQEHTYQVIIPAGGTLLTDIKIDSPLIPGIIKVSQLTIVPFRYAIPNRF